jgi:hypothetical protein
MRKKGFSYATLVVTSTAALFAASSCEQPPVLCTCGRGDFAAKYTLVDGTGECATLTSELLGMNAYSPEKNGPNSGSMADWHKSSVAIGSERIGWFMDRAGRSSVPVDPAQKHYVIGDFPEYPAANDFCSFSAARADAQVVLPALPPVADNPMTMVDDSEPAVEATSLTYKWTNVNFLVRPDAIGTQMTADLQYTKNGCTANYKVKAVYPARNCESRTTPGQPDPDLCSPVSQPDKNIFEGSGISPDFPVECVEFDPGSPGGAKRFFCMITKDVPAFK